MSTAFGRFDLKKLRDPHHMTQVEYLLSSYIQPETGEGWASNIADYVTSVLWTHATLGRVALRAQCERDFEKFLDSDTKEFVERLFKYIEGVAAAEPQPPAAAAAAAAAADRRHSRRRSRSRSRSGSRSRSPTRSRSSSRSSRSSRSRSRSRSRSWSPRRRFSSSSYDAHSRPLQRGSGGGGGGGGANAPLSLAQQHAAHRRAVGLQLPQQTQQASYALSNQQLATAAAMMAAAAAARMPPMTTAAAMHSQQQQPKREDEEQHTPTMQPISAPQQVPPMFSLGSQQIQQAMQQQQPAPFFMAAAAAAAAAASQQQQRHFQQQSSLMPHPPADHTMQQQQRPQQQQYLPFRREVQQHGPLPFGRIGRGPPRDPRSHEQRMLEDQSLATLLVLNVPTTFNSHAPMRNCFGKFGTVTNVETHTDRRLAFVKFARHSEAVSAYKSTAPLFGNRFVRLAWVNRDSFDMPEFDYTVDPSAVVAAAQQPEEATQQMAVDDGEQRQKDAIAKAQLLDGAKAQLAKSQGLLEMLDAFPPAERDPIARRVANIIAAIEPVFQTVLLGVPASAAGSKRPSDDEPIDVSALKTRCAALQKLVQLKAPPPPPQEQQVVVEQYGGTAQGVAVVTHDDEDDAD